MSRKEKFSELVKAHGYTSVHKFCLENKLNQGNISLRLTDENIKVELPLLFMWAGILEEPIDSLIEIFYPEEFAENQAIAKGKKKG